MSRFQGRSAEKRFSTLCSDEGVTCNPAQEDDHGWDHVVQFPHRAAVGVPTDLQRSLPPVFVQTKSQGSDPPVVRMKLSNALALARSPNPCFVAVASSTDHEDERIWYGLHVWEDFIARTLKRAREATRDEIDPDTFHKKWITFKLTRETQYEGADLIRWIEQTVQGIPEYAAAKASLLSSVGFDAARFEGVIQFAPMRSVDELLDHQLGLTDTVPITKFEVSDRRFGIPVKLPIPQGSGMVGTLHAHPRECHLRLRGPDGREINVTGELILGTLPGLPVEQCKLRVRTKFLDLVWRISGDTQFRFKYNTRDLHSVGNLLSLLLLVSWSGKGPIDLQVYIEDQRLFGGTANLDHRDEQPKYAYLAEIVDVLANLSSHIRSAVPMISIENLIESDELAALHAFLSTSSMKASAALQTKRRPNLDHVITFGFAKVGDWRFGALTRWEISEQRYKSGVLVMQLEDRKILESYAVQHSSPRESSAFRADYDRYVNEPGALAMDDAVAKLSGGS